MGVHECLFPSSAFQWVLVSSAVGLLGSWPGFASQAWVAPVVEVVSWVSSSRETEVGFWKHVRERQAAGALAEPQHCAVGKEGGGAAR